MKKMCHNPYKAIILIALVFFLATGFQAMAAETAGKILRLEGSAVIDRNGETIKAESDTEIYVLDQIKTGPDSLLHILFKDGSSLHLGPESVFELSQYKFSMMNEKPSLIARMSKGLFVFISGAISKVNPGAVKFETPEATIGIRGTKLVVKIVTEQSPENEKSMVIDFRDQFGNVGTLKISNAYGSQTLNQDFYHVVLIKNGAPSKPKPISREELEKLIPESLWDIVFENYTPPLGYTEIEFPLNEIERYIVQPEKPRPYSAETP